MDLSILHDQEGFRRHAIQRLGQNSLNYVEELEFIRAQRNLKIHWGAAGVLLLLFFEEDRRSGQNHSGNYVFLLNKRSNSVPQAGDLCAPGGGIHPFFDKILQNLLRVPFLPVGKGPGLELSKKKGKALYRHILFFLGNALRESWEEMRLSPFNVEFLGALPTYRLQSRKWLLFPIVGRVKAEWHPRLSAEVEEIIKIPLHFFYSPENYALFSLKIPEDIKREGPPGPREFPCLVYPLGGRQEVLGGATFHILRTFLTAVLSHSLPFPNGQRIIRKTLAPNYYGGGTKP
jgi:8-oxo-dGTP pyrophosphatase MutT (NUDIX family)